MWRDEHTGLYHTHYRLYDPQHVRWLTPDPAGYRDGQNLYRFYAGPNGVDVLGLDAYFFEGTGNHPHPFNPECHREPGKKNYITNVRRMWEAYNGGAAIYIYGIGSGYSADGTVYSSSYWNLYWTSWGNSRLEGGAGKSFDSRVEYAIDNLKARLATGDENAKLIDVVGFSRGSGGGLEFLHCILDGIRDGTIPSDVKIRTVTLYDTVGAIGWSGECDISDMGKRLYLPSTKQLKYLSTPVQAVALDEQRAEFQVNKLIGAINIGFRGVHSDIGSGYIPTLSLAAFPLLYMVNGANDAFPGLYDTSKIRFGSDKYEDIMKYEDLLADENKTKGMELFINLYFRPSSNEALEFNDGATRRFPDNMIFHSSVKYLTRFKFKNNVGYHWNNDLQGTYLSVKPK
jgi:hypothetical protein